MNPFSPTLGQSVLAGATTAAWYALPDVVRCRGARVVLKTGLLAAFGAGWVLARPRTEAPIGPQGPDQLDEVFELIREEPAKALAIGGAAVAFTAVCAVLGEKAIFRFGERRRARGVWGAHTVPGIVIGALTTAAAAVPLP